MRFIYIYTMCGIAGIISHNKQNVSVDKLKHMTDAIAYRGPDGEGRWINDKGNVGLGHRRLSIIDLSNKGAQPMHYLNRYLIIHNGEIYNYIELRDILKKKGYTFQSQSDTEIISAAYDYWKEECLHQFDGMFAFAIWDEQEQTLFAARDRFGEKPFYYYRDEEQFLFASEMKALWAAGVKKEMNNTFLLYYLADGQLSNPHNPSETFFENIFTLPAASYLKYNITTNDFIIQRWWNLDKEAVNTISEKEAIEKLFHLLSSSVSKRLRSDVEAGNSLSGGLDSSSILAMIYRQGKDFKPKTFSAVFPGFEKDESIYISKVLSQYPSHNFAITPTADDFNKDVAAFFYHHEQPVQSASVYLQYKVFQLAKQNEIKVLLDGQGADEILGGYIKYLHWYLQELVCNGKLRLAEKEKQLLQNNYPSLQWGWKNYIAAFTPSLTARQLKKNVFKKTGFHPDIDPDFSFHSFSKQHIYKPSVQKLNDILYYDTMQNTLPELLHYADRNSMAHGVEVRLPFLNNELVQFIFSLPSSYKIKNGFTKWILRKTTAPLLPAEISWRKDKTGYEPPQQQWMQQPQLQEQIHEARKKLVKEQVLMQTVLNKPIIAKAAHDANNYDWRYLSAAQTL